MRFPPAHLPMVPCPGDLTGHQRTAYTGLTVDELWNAVVELGFLWMCCTPRLLELEWLLELG